jgi:hypothetical protein
MGWDLDAVSKKKEEVFPPKEDLFVARPCWPPKAATPSGPPDRVQRAGAPAFPSHTREDAAPYSAVGIPRQGEAETGSLESVESHPRIFRDGKRCRVKIQTFNPHGERGSGAAGRRGGSKAGAGRQDHPK